MTGAVLEERAAVVGEMMVEDAVVGAVGLDGAASVGAGGREQDPLKG